MLADVGGNRLGGGNDDGGRFLLARNSRPQDRQSGEKRYRTEVICDNFQMLGSRGGATADHDSSGPEPAEPHAVGAPAADDDDIPF